MVPVLIDLMVSEREKHRWTNTCARAHTRRIVKGKNKARVIRSWRAEGTFLESAFVEWRTESWAQAVVMPRQREGMKRHGTFQPLKECLVVQG